MARIPLPDHLLNLLDYADQLVPLITANNSDTRNYFMTLVYIEDIFDTYGREFLLPYARQSHDGEHAYKQAVNERLENLRKTIRELSQAYDFDETLKRRGQTFYEGWGRR